jgi:antitoxin component of RelBE/YafQ-DinJ toxin-antitoxin module
MTVTLNIDDELLERARKFAERRGISLEQMVGDYLREVAYDAPNMPLEDVIRKLERLWDVGSGDSRGEKWTREEMHERRRLP